MFNKFAALGAAAALALPSVATNAQQPDTINELDAAKTIFKSGNLKGCVEDLLRNKDSSFPRGSYQRVSCNYALSDSKKGIVFYSVDNSEDTKRTPKTSYQLSVNEYFSTRLEAQTPVETENSKPLFIRYDISADNKDGTVSFDFGDSARALTKPEMNAMRSLAKAMESSAKFYHETTMVVCSSPLCL